MMRNQRYIIIISLLFASGMLATSLSSFFVSRSSLRSRIIQGELPLTSDNIYSEMQRDLIRPILISSLMAQDTFLRDWIINGEKSPSRIIKYLKEVKTKYHAFTSFFVSEKTRNYYHAEGILKRVKASEKRDRWYFRVRKMKKEFEINVDPDLANRDAMTIFINYKVLDYRNRFIGATGIGLTVYAVKKLIETYKERYQCEVFFTDDKGKIVLHGSHFPPEYKHIDNIEGLSSLKKDLYRKKKHCFEYRRGGSNIHLNIRYIPEFNWYLLVERTEKTALQNIITSLIINIVICILITALVLFITTKTVSAFNRRLQKMATIDNLTGAFNRHSFSLVITQMLREKRRKDFPLSVILFDIDYFKEVNDTFGHIAGDRVLQNIYSATMKTIREQDILFRWGGEEFLILLKDCTVENAYSVAEKLRKNLGEVTTRYEEKSISVTASFGVVEYRTDEKTDECIKRVDDLLYRAKKEGRNRSVREE